MFLQEGSPDQPDDGLISGISPASVTLYEVTRTDDTASSAALRSQKYGPSYSQTHCELQLCAA